MTDEIDWLTHGLAEKEYVQRQFVNHLDEVR